MSSVDEDLGPATALDEQRHELHQDLLAFLRRGEGDFDTLAVRVLRYQAAALPAYARLVSRLGASLDSWQTAPMVPTELFQELDLCSRPVGKKDLVFRTSGTTVGRRGSRRVPDPTLYRTAMAHPFIAGVLDGDASRRRWISLIPRADVLPDSSLTFMVTELAGALASETYWVMEKDGIDFDLAKTALGEGHGSGDERVLVLTTAFALAELLDKLRWPPRLPPGSRVMLTGGFKGKNLGLSEAELLAKLEAILGVPPSLVRAEYGMTELTSQAYGTPFIPMGTLRFRVVHPESGAALGPGEVGLVGCFDLLNLDNVSSILTSDLGALDAQGRLTLHGRRPGATPRGCSLSAEEILAKVAR